jgi:hypothetical protein
MLAGGANRKTAKTKLGYAEIGIKPQYITV